MRKKILQILLCLVLALASAAFLRPKYGGEITVYLPGSAKDSPHLKFLERVIRGPMSFQYPSQGNGRILSGGIVTKDEDRLLRIRFKDDILTGEGTRVTQDEIETSVKKALNSGSILYYKPEEQPERGIDLKPENATIFWSLYYLSLKRVIKNSGLYFRPAGDKGYTLRANKFFPEGRPFVNAIHFETGSPAKIFSRFLRAGPSALGVRVLNERSAALVKAAKRRTGYREAIIIYLNPSGFTSAEASYISNRLRARDFVKGISHGYGRVMDSYFEDTTPEEESGIADSVNLVLGDIEIVKCDDSLHEQVAARIRKILEVDGFRVRIRKGSRADASSNSKQIILSSVIFKDDADFTREFIISYERAGLGLNEFFNCADINEVKSRVSSLRARNLVIPLFECDFVLIFSDNIYGPEDWAELWTGER